MANQSPDTIVIDLDGTLADIDHRLPLIRRSPPNYEAFFAAVGDDRLNGWCRELMRAFRGRYRVVLVSGRPERTRSESEAWLRRQDVPYDDLILVRADGDFRPDDFLKRSWLRQYRPERILFAVDDRQRVVDMWRTEGVVCLQCAAWKEIRRSRQKRPADDLD